MSINKSLQIVLFLVVLPIFWSCKVQNKSENNLPRFNSDSLGEIVGKLDDQTWQIHQDQKGHYWFGSNRNGVITYDGSSLIRFSQLDGLVDNTIRGIQEDHLGNIYIETPKGISKYDGITFETLEPIRLTSNEWNLDPNDLWFACNGNANDVYRYDGKSLMELRLPRKDLEKTFGREVRGLSFKDMSSSPYSVFGIDKDQTGNVWIGTIVAGAFRYDGDSFLWFPEEELSTLPDGRVPGVRSMLQDKNGYFWLSNFISKYNIIEQDSILDYEKLKGVDTSSIYFKDRIPYFNSGLSDKQGDLWMATYGGGVWRYDGEELYNWKVYNGENEVLIISIYADNNGVLWLGTDNAGVYTFDGEKFNKFEPVLDSVRQDK